MNIPFYLTFSIIGVAAYATIALPFVLAQASKRVGLPTNTSIPVGMALGSWFVLTILLTIVGTYHLVLWGVIPVLGISLLATLVSGVLAITFYRQLQRVISHPTAQSGLIAL